MKISCPLTLAGQSERPKCKLAQTRIPDEIDRVTRRRSVLEDAREEPRRNIDLRFGPTYARAPLPAIGALLEVPSPPPFRLTSMQRRDFRDRWAAENISTPTGSGRQQPGSEPPAPRRGGKESAGTDEPKSFGVGATWFSGIYFGERKGASVLRRQLRLAPVLK